MVCMYVRPELIYRTKHVTTYINQFYYTSEVFIILNTELWHLIW